jgi:hypothetical protein
MIKKTKLVLVILIITILFTIAFSGCPDPDPTPDPNPTPNPTYTVWTDSMTYSDFASTFSLITLDDGYYIRVELTDSDWNTISPSLTNEGKNYWTENQLKNWFIGRGFDNTKANEATAWLMTTNHCFIASRAGSVVYIIIK